MKGDVNVSKSGYSKPISKVSLNANKRNFIESKACKLHSTLKVLFAKICVVCVIRVLSIQGLPFFILPATDPSGH